jgi:uncharacterized damage-inducible protein DinB
MQTQNLFKYWNDVRAVLYEAFDLITDEQLSFTPREGLWSLHETLCHIAGVEEGWFRYVVTREIGGWDEAEFNPADYPTRADLRVLLDRVHARTTAMFAAESDLSAAMQREITMPRGGHPFTVEWVTWHVIEHEIHHRGEVFLMLGLLGIEAPDV